MMISNGNGTVSVPAEWIIELEEYRIRLKETEDTYNDLKRIYEE